MTHQFKPGDRVRCVHPYGGMQVGDVHEVLGFYGACMELKAFGPGDGWPCSWFMPAATPPAYSIPAACQQRPCFTCGKPTPDEVCEQHKPVASVTEQAEYLASVEEYHKDSQWTFVQPVACTPDDQPETYEARRARKAGERNPGQGDDMEPDSPRRDCPWKCYPNDPKCVCEPPQPGEGIQRAVDRLSQVEHRIGAAKYQP